MSTRARCEGTEWVGCTFEIFDTPDNKSFPWSVTRPCMLYARIHHECISSLDQVATRLDHVVQASEQTAHVTRSPPTTSKSPRCLSRRITQSFALPVNQKFNCIPCLDARLGIIVLEQGQLAVADHVQRKYVLWYGQKQKMCSRREVPYGFPSCRHLTLNPHAFEIPKIL
ncbi:uncharacterized protein PV06_07438 [Exophiala oligosperma]|uniref:Uncharacterized protein n=1 Tax=Exophiala oligosperma TaxID=215243 RepID=A0A0D2DXI5_9EURO|nr:uncharacterized protein PV06_07438 [Exophiala oligosperma]KIW40224.1 hypothetical protein PV06_07438 [Exophiala oligosperma]